jgi:peptidoglycan/LPS O-acetylase OafA/YrhL
MRIINQFLQKHSNRVVGLDIIRSVAILQVVYAHGTILLPIEHQTKAYNLSPISIDGVLIFFVLSGFLIGRILLKVIKQTNFTLKDVFDFWIRRWFRTIPTYYLVLLIAVAYRYIFYGDTVDFSYKFFLFIQNFYTPHPAFYPEAWSLTIEEWFYIIFPLLCFLFIKITKNISVSVFFAILIMLIFPLISRIIKFENGLPENLIDTDLRKVLLYRLDSLMYGVIAAIICLNYKNFWIKSKYYFLFIGIIFLVIFKTNPSFLNGIYIPLTFNFESIVVFCFLPFLDSLKTTKIKLIDSFFIFISLISYSMYLLNLSIVINRLLPLMQLFLDKISLHPTEVFISNFIAYWIFTLVFSYLLYRFFENPVTRLRDKIKTSKSPLPKTRIK